ncbi:hypothetical protein AK830_g7340 [Neonectria ditissima]|uniref:Zn(2)-C6 fungal-type domain-containing protein n=1 Tax=Neonectria ditissima TaxID=78410 RepID=A0A0P7BGF2_9HYPO|nr:hypothetical protein AK830_g7340 [Neonectria ditissima]
MSEQPAADPAESSRLTKRRRPATACEQCRRRKVRCDQSLPCGPCTRSRLGLYCSYPPGITLRLFPRPGPSNVPHQDGCSAPPPSTDPTFNQSCTPRQETQASETFPSVQRDSDVQSLGETKTLGTLPAPRLRNGLDKTRLFGRSHWIYAAERLPGILANFDAKEADFALEGGGADIVAQFLEVRRIRRAVKLQSSARIDEVSSNLLEILPQKEICDVLISCYARTFDQIYRIIHLPSFRADYDRFWQDPGSFKTPNHFIMTLFVTSAIGSTFYTGSGSSDIRQWAPIWIQTAQSWLTGPSEKSTHSFDGLQVFTLLLLSRQTTYNAPGTGWISPASLLSMAMSMGLHRNPDLFASLSGFQTEMRKRLWAAVVELVIQSHLDSGIPVLLSGHDFDSVAPLNIDDKDVNPDTKSLPTPRDGFTDSSLQIQLVESQSLRLEISKLINDSQSTHSYEKTLQLGSEMRAACRQMATFFSQSPTTHSGTTSTVTEFHRRFFDIAFHRYILLLHRPFMIDSLDDPKFCLARKLCVESATVMVSYAIDMVPCLEQLRQDDLFLLASTGRNSFKGPFNMDVILVLGLELLVQLDEQGAGNLHFDRLDELLQINRSHLRLTLEKTLNVLLEILKSGSVSTKAYNFLAALLAQAQAIETGQCGRKAAYDSIRDTLKTTLEVLKRHNNVGLEYREGGAANEPADMNTVPSLNFELFDFSSNWDISNILYLPDIDGDSQDEFNFN